jgi:hypothetical protein
LQLSNIQDYFQFQCNTKLFFCLIRRRHTAFLLDIRSYRAVTMLIFWGALANNNGSAEK